VKADAPCIDAPMIADMKQAKMGVTADKRRQV
jgi:hypothetical protein